MRRTLIALFAALCALPALAVAPGVLDTVILGGYAPAYLFNASSGVLPSWLSFSRAGNAMMFDSTGALTYAPSNALTNSNAASVWTKQSGVSISDNTVPGPIGGVNGSTVSWGAAANATGFYQSGFAMNGAANIKAIWVRADAAGGTIEIADPNAPAAIGSITLTTSWQLLYVKDAAGSQPALGGLWVRKTASSPSTVYVSSATLSRVTYEASPRSVDQVITASAAYYGPRFDADPATLAAKGLLVEAAATNLLPYSNSFTSWTVLHSPDTPTGNAAVSPDGTSNASRINTTSAVAGVYGSYQVYTYAAATYVMSCYAKAGTYGYFTIDLSNNSTSAAFNLNTGAVIATAAGVTNGIISAGNGWWRVWASATMSAATGYPEFYLNGSASVLSRNWTPSGTETAYVYGCQLEAGAAPTSYILTMSATITRAADVLSASGYAANPAIIQYINEQTGVTARKVINPWSGVSAETYEWISTAAIYPAKTPSAYLNSRLTVNGPY